MLAHSSSQINKKNIYTYKLGGSTLPCVFLNRFPAYHYTVCIDDKMAGKGTQLCIFCVCMYSEKASERGVNLFSIWPKNIFIHINIFMLTYTDN